MKIISSLEKVSNTVSKLERKKDIACKNINNININKTNVNSKITH